jgi:predicted nucleic acid-binding protein
VSASFVVDASVVVEFLAPVRAGSPADRFMGGLAWPEPVELFAPDLLLLEVANTLRKLTAAGHLPQTVAGRLVARLPELAIATVGSAVLLSGAWALRQNMTVYDASYAALARELSCPLVTSDAKLARACRAADIRAFKIDDPELDAVLTVLEQTGH